jgi:hypothetical protein
MSNHLAFNLKDAFFGPSDKYPTNPSQVGPFVSIFARNAILIAGLICVIMIVVGGLGVIASAGKGNQQSAGKGKAALTAGAAGFVIVFCAYWIVQIIEIITGITIF